MQSDVFAAALLSSEQPVPAFIKGRPAKRFAVYRNNVVMGLIRAMESNFPVLRRLLGDVYFAGLAREFVQAHPPRSPLMFEFGSGFPAFLAAQRDLFNYPYLSDVARLAVLMRQSHHESDAPILDPAELARVPENFLGAVVFKSHPALRMLSSDFAVAAIARSNMGDGEGRVDRPVTPEWLIVTRPHHDVLLTSVDRAQFVFVESLAAGHALADAIDMAFEIDNEFNLANGLSLLLARGAFTSLEQQGMQE